MCGKRPFLHYGEDPVKHFGEPIHAVIVCARALDRDGKPKTGMDDYLELTLTQNRSMLDHVVVVTTQDDDATRRIASAHGCDVLLTEEGREPGRFKKGVMVERGLQQLPGDGYHVQMDCDILLPGNFRHALSHARMKAGPIYGCDRFDVVGPDGLESLRRTGWLDRGWQWQQYLRGVPNGFRPSSRLIHHEQGWVPIGFFQAAAASTMIGGATRYRSYPLHSSDAGHDDLQFALRWDRAERVFLPELLLGHLTTSDSKFGSNWNGRTTSRFDGQIAKDSAKAPGKASEVNTHNSGYSC